jgi:hypothetical protein
MSELTVARSRRALASAFKLAFAIATLMVAVLSLLPGNDLPAVGISDKFEHIIAYAVLALLGGLAIPGATVLLAVGLSALGVAMEICQMVVPGRSARLRTQSALASASRWRCAWSDGDDRGKVSKKTVSGHTAAAFVGRSVWRVESQSFVVPAN